MSASAAHAASAFEDEDDDVRFRPFVESRRGRLDRIRRTSDLLTALRATSSTSDLNVVVVVDPRTKRRLVVRPLTDDERTVLEGPICRCRSDDWTKVRIAHDEAAIGADATRALEDQIERNEFRGWVVLGVSIDGVDAAAAVDRGADGKGKSGEREDDGARKFLLRPGVRNNSLIVDCVLEPGCVVVDNLVVAETHVQSDGTVARCGEVRCSSTSSSGTLAERMTIPVGPESGGSRIVPVSPESTMIDVCRSLGMGRRRPFSDDDGNKSPPRPVVRMNVISSGAILSDTPEVRGVHLSPDSSVRSAASVADCILLPRAAIDDGSVASNAYLQWNATITSHSHVSRVLLMEQSQIGPHSFVSDSLLGPDVHVSAGEVHRSLLGPSVNSHHQSLLIGVLWPLGRGNVGYGSNVGSNHTGRIPDQECCAGEGTFWGLSSVIKFPVNLSESPYSVVAAGTSLGPQNVSMPFSLIVGDGGAKNEIVPGWVLSQSPYTIVRSEVKFATRRKAKRHAFYTGWKIVRPGIVDLVWKARESLRSAEAPLAASSSGEATAERRHNHAPTERRAEGIGANRLTERGRRLGAEAYTKFVRRYALRGLLDRMELFEGAEGAFESLSRELGPNGNGVVASHGPSSTSSPPDDGAEGGDDASWPPLPWEEEGFDDDKNLWSHQLDVLRKELPSMLGEASSSSSKSTNASSISSPQILRELLLHLVDVERDHARRVKKSKSRDDARGRSVVPGYASAHVSADEDEVVKSAERESNDVERRVNALLRLLENEDERNEKDGAAATRRSRL